jgi:ribose transport system substrate-binding protein
LGKKYFLEEVMKRILLGLVALALLAGCKKEETKVADLSNVTIGTCVMSLQHPFMADLVIGYNEFQKQTNLNLIVTDGGNMEPEKQVSNLENFITQRVDGILIQAIDINTLRDTINRAADEGIPLGYYPHTEGIKASTYFNYVEYDWGYQLGVEAAKWVKTRLSGRAKIINLQSSLEPSSIERAEGWRAAVNRECGENNIQWVLIEAKTAEDAAANVERALQANPDAQLVLVFNGLFAKPVTEAVKASGLQLDNFFIGSCDGTADELDLVEEPNSIFRCTVANNRFVTEIGYHWLQTIVRAALKMPFDNPFPITTIAINAENVGEYRARQPNYKLDPEIEEYLASLKN